MPTSHYTCKVVTSIVLFSSERRFRTKSAFDTNARSRLQRSQDVFPAVCEQEMGSASNENRQFSAAASILQLHIMGLTFIFFFRSLRLYLGFWHMIFRCCVCVCFCVAEEANRSVFAELRIFCCSSIERKLLETISNFTTENCQGQERIPEIPVAADDSFFVFSFIDLMFGILAVNVVSTHLLCRSNNSRRRKKSREELISMSRSECASITTIVSHTFCVFVLCLFFQFYLPNWRFRPESKRAMLQRFDGVRRALYVPSFIVIVSKPMSMMSPGANIFAQFFALPSPFVPSYSVFISSVRRDAASCDFI